MAWWFQFIAQVATDITACVAVFGYGSYRLAIHRRVRMVERELSSKAWPNGNYRTAQQLAIALTLTEDQVIDAAARSRIIESCPDESATEYRFRIRRKATSA